MVAKLAARSVEGRFCLDCLAVGVVGGVVFGGGHGGGGG